MGGTTLQESTAVKLGLKKMRMSILHHLHVLPIGLLFVFNILSSSSYSLSFPSSSSSLSFLSSSSSSYSSSSSFSSLPLLLS